MTPRAGMTQIKNASEWFVLYYIFISTGYQARNGRYLIRARLCQPPSGAGHSSLASYGPAAFSARKAVPKHAPISNLVEQDQQKPQCTRWTKHSSLAEIVEQCRVRSFVAAG